MTVKTLSVKQPWAYALLHGKDFENRNWPTRYRGRLIIHASLSVDRSEFDWIRHEMKMALPDVLPVGKLIGEVELIECHLISDELTRRSPWAFGPYCWEVKNPVIYEKPIPCRGQLRLFDVDIYKLLAENLSTEICPNCHKPTSGGLYHAYTGVDEAGIDRFSVLHCGCYHEARRGEADYIAEDDQYYLDLAEALEATE